MDWSCEAQAVIEDIRDFVSSISVANSPKSENSRICFDIETLEKESFTIVMDSSGFHILDDTSTVYETINALLSTKSVGFRNAFASALMSKLNSLSHMDRSL